MTEIPKKKVVAIIMAEIPKKGGRYHNG